MVIYFHHNICTELFWNVSYLQGRRLVCEEEQIKAIIPENSHGKWIRLVSDRSSGRLCIVEDDKYKINRNVDAIVIMFISVIKQFCIKIGQS